MPTPKAWSLVQEIYVLDAAVTGARMLADLVAHDQAQDEHDARHAADAASAVLTLVGLRLRELTRVLRGERDPADLRAEHNSVPADTGSPDVVFPRAARRARPTKNGA